VPGGMKTEACTGGYTNPITWNHERQAPSMTTRSPELRNATRLSR
jgi:hypothetical protein